MIRVLVALAFLIHPLAAEELVVEKQLPYTLALEAATAALDGCLAQGYRIAVAVVDRSGNVRVQLRADGAGAHLIEGSLRKAYTSAMVRIPTKTLGEIIEKSPTSGGLLAFEHMTALGGGLPIKSGDTVIAGIGVGGVPVGGAGGAGDEGCAKLGVDKITARIQP